MSDCIMTLHTNSIYIYLKKMHNTFLNMVQFQDHLILSRRFKFKSIACKVKTNLGTFNDQNVTIKFFFVITSFIPVLLIKFGTYRFFGTYR